ncbi:phosphoribosyl-AMP cyclohydrolase [Alphaproteobacteria bacterium]|jgi:phosphoribosyl-AMP cyclohydrolase|nr:phosphoribosyl-AMP cyclohydrolase [Alphaproteobacteria bacterium]
MREFIAQLKFDANGLIPAIAQQWDTGEVLMMAWMSKETLLKSLEQKRVIYYSRSKQSEWRKGDSSGHIQQLKEVRTDCDMDCLLLLIEQTGSACHENTRSCFTKQISQSGISTNADTAYPALVITPKN